MTINKIKSWFSYWKQPILISVFCITFLIIAQIYFPDDENPFYPHKLRTGTQVMAERWPLPVDCNDPNFLADFREYMGFDFHRSEDTIAFDPNDTLEQTSARLRERYH